jgi:glutathione S-transferase
LLIANAPGAHARANAATTIAAASLAKTISILRSIDCIAARIARTGRSSVEAPPGASSCQGGEVRSNVLITIPISHFCEKARWALDRARIPYVEKRHVQFVHIVAAKRAGGGRTVPVLVPDDGPAIGESEAILRWIDARTEPERRLYDGDAEMAAFARRLDEGFGPAGRLWMYEQTLPVLKSMRPWALAGTPRWEQAGFRVLAPLLDRGLRRYLSVDAAHADAALRVVDEVFDEVAERLSDGRRFLFGERFSAADLTFAALAAPALLPTRYGSPLPQPPDLPAGYAREVTRLREHAAGRFAARLYDEERG